MRRSIILLVLLTGCTIIQPMPDQDVFVQIREPEDIALIGTMEKIPNALGLAYVWPDGPCRIVVPPLTHATRYIWAHEIRHCKEGQFHD